MLFPLHPAAPELEELLGKARASLKGFPMPTDMHGKQFSQLREFYKEMESLGVVGLHTNEPNTSQTIDEALDAIVSNNRQVLFELEACRKFGR